MRPAVAETNAAVRNALISILLGPDGSEVSLAAAEPLAVIVEAPLRGVALQWMADPDGVDLAPVVACTRIVHDQAAALNLAT